MHRLILMRHAKAEARSDSGQDFDRPLSLRGERQARTMGRVLAQAGLAPNVALVSSAVRTQTTWALAAPALGDPPVLFDRNLYSASWLSVLEMAEGRPEATVLVIGHNPTVHDLALALLRQEGASQATTAKVQARFPPATAIAFTFDAAQRPRYDGFFLVADQDEAE